MREQLSTPAQSGSNYSSFIIPILKMKLEKSSNFSEVTLTHEWWNLNVATELGTTFEKKDVLQPQASLAQLSELEAVLCPPSTVPSVIFHSIM